MAAPDEAGPDGPGPPRRVPGFGPVPRWAVRRVPAATATPAAAPGRADAAGPAGTWDAAPGAWPPAPVSDATARGASPGPAAHAAPAGWQPARPAVAPFPAWPPPAARVAPRPAPAGPADRAPAPADEDPGPAPQSDPDPEPSAAEEDALPPLFRRPERSARLRRSDDLGLRRALSDRLLPGLVAAMAFLAALALAGAVGAAALAGQWQHGAASVLTVQVPDPTLPAQAPAGTPRGAAALALLAATPGVADARLLGHDELAALLRPWLGEGAGGLSLPLPAVIELRLGQPPADAAALSARLGALAPGSLVESSGAWTDRLAVLARSLQACAAAALLVVAGGGGGGGGGGDPRRAVGAPRRHRGGARAGRHRRPHRRAVRGPRHAAGHGGRGGGGAGRAAAAAGHGGAGGSLRPGGHGRGRARGPGGGTAAGLAVRVARGGGVGHGTAGGAVGGAALPAARGGHDRLGHGAADGAALAAAAAVSGVLPDGGEASAGVGEAPGAGPTRRRLSRGLAAVLALGLAAWLGGFAVFVRSALRPAPAVAVSDGIVALTGGAGRIEAALRLLAGGGGRVLLVSGVACGAELGELARRAGVDPAALAGRVTLGHQARTTLGNAAETAAWARAEGLGSLTVVTASYHMGRALAEIGRALPGVALRPDPVVPPALRGAESLATLRLMGGEYTKWLAVRAGLTRLLPPRLLPARASGRGCAVGQRPSEAGGVSAPRRAAARPLPLGGAA